MMVDFPWALLNSFMVLESLRLDKYFGLDMGAFKQMYPYPWIPHGKAGA